MIFVSDVLMHVNFTVTLIGAHSLGRVHIANSGYGFADSTFDPILVNAWESTPDLLDNGYFANLLELVRGGIALLKFNSPRTTKRNCHNAFL